MTRDQSSLLAPAFYWLALAGSVGLIAVGAVFILDNRDAARLFGVPLALGPSDAYLNAAAVRDIALGALALVFTLLRDRRAVGLTVLLGGLIPLGDGFTVLAYSPTPLLYLPLHWGGVLACLVFALLLLRPRKMPASAPGTPMSS